LEHRRVKRGIARVGCEDDRVGEDGVARDPPIRPGGRSLRLGTRGRGRRRRRRLRPRVRNRDAPRRTAGCEDQRKAERKPAGHHPSPEESLKSARRWCFASFRRKCPWLECTIRAGGCVLISFWTMSASTTVGWLH